MSLMHKLISLSAKDRGVSSSTIYPTISVYVNVEPCIMCAAALMKVRKVLSNFELYRLVQTNSDIVGILKSKSTPRCLAIFYFA